MQRQLKVNYIGAEGMHTTLTNFEVIEIDKIPVVIIKARTLMEIFEDLNGAKQIESELERI